MDKQDTSKGYVLLYTMLVITLFLALGTSLVVSSVREVELGTLEIESAKAYAAAEAAIECIAYWQLRSGWRPFDSNKDAVAMGVNVNCDMPGNAQPMATYYNAAIAPVCEAYSYPTTTLQYFTNGACVDVTVSVRPVLPVDPGDKVCMTLVEAHGYSDCSGKPIAERVRWREF